MKTAPFLCDAKAHDNETGLPCRSPPNHASSSLRSARPSAALTASLLFIKEQSHPHKIIFFYCSAPPSAQLVPTENLRRHDQHNEFYVLAHSQRAFVRCGIKWHYVNMPYHSIRASRHGFAGRHRSIESLFSHPQNTHVHTVRHVAQPAARPHPVTTTSPRQASLHASLICFGYLLISNTPVDPTLRYAVLRGLAGQALVIGIYFPF